MVVQAIPQVCPYFKRRAAGSHVLRGICSVKHKLVAALIDTSVYGDEFIAVHRWCQIADLAGDGYLNCPIFSGYFWAVLQEKAASEIAKYSTEKSEQRSEAER